MVIVATLYNWISLRTLKQLCSPIVKNANRVSTLSLKEIESMYQLMNIIQLEGQLGYIEASIFCKLVNDLHFFDALYHQRTRDPLLSLRKMPRDIVDHVVLPYSDQSLTLKLTNQYTEGEVVRKLAVSNIIETEGLNGDLSLFLSKLYSKENEFRSLFYPHELEGDVQLDLTPRGRNCFYRL